MLNMPDIPRSHLVVADMTPVVKNFDRFSREAEQPLGNSDWPKSGLGRMRGNKKLGAYPGRLMRGTTMGDSMEGEA